MHRECTTAHAEFCLTLLNRTTYNTAERASHAEGGVLATSEVAAAPCIIYMWHSTAAAPAVAVAAVKF